MHDCSSVPSSESCKVDCKIPFLFVFVRDPTNSYVYWLRVELMSVLNVQDIFHSPSYWVANVPD